MSGLLALLDDVASIAKVAATSLDDVVSGAAKAGAKAAGAVIDDAAVTPKYLDGFKPARELPIVGRIALGSIRNKLVILLPLALLLSAFLEQAIAPLLMLGGAYLCFEGAEKVWHSLFPGEHHVDHGEQEGGDPAHLEEEKVSGAIKTDFILSAEIMTIALAAIPPGTIWVEAVTLALVAVAITVVVYGSVALIVKADDVGLLMCRHGHFALTRSIGRLLVRAMPGLMRTLTIVGTAAMLWVGGSIIVHGLEEMGLGGLGQLIHDLAGEAGHAMPPEVAGAAEWVAGAVMYGIFGLVLGILLIAPATWLIAPAWKAVFGRSGH